MTLARRLSQLERSAARLVADLEADLDAGRRQIEDCTDAELELLTASLAPAERAWLEGLSDGELRRVAAGELVYPGDVTRNVAK